MAEHTAPHALHEWFGLWPLHDGNGVPDGRFLMVTRSGWPESGRLSEIEDSKKRWLVHTITPRNEQNGSADFSASRAAMRADHTDPKTNITDEEFFSFMRKQGVSFDRNPLHKTIKFYEWVLSNTYFRDSITDLEFNQPDMRWRTIYHQRKESGEGLWMYFHGIIGTTHWVDEPGWVGSRLSRAVESCRLPPEKSKKLGGGYIMYEPLRAIFTDVFPPLDKRVPDLRWLARQTVENHKPSYDDAALELANHTLPRVFTPLPEPK
jgi:hypothetical protein